MMKRFIVAVKTGTNYSYGFITPDDQKNMSDHLFYFNVIKTSFSGRDGASKMLYKWQQTTPKTLYSTNDISKLSAIVNNDSNTQFAMLFDDDWSMLIERK